jgi:hypothetical protein
MGDLLEQGASWLADQRRKHLSRIVTYSRGADTIEVAAGIGSTTFEVIDDLGVTQLWKSRDFLVAAEDLAIAGVQIEPQRGDRIVDAGRIYEVLAPGKGHVFQVDAYGKTFRIHTKQVDQQ